MSTECCMPTLPQLTLRIPPIHKSKLQDYWTPCGLWLLHHSRTGPGHARNRLHLRSYMHHDLWQFPCSAGIHRSTYNLSIQLRRHHNRRDWTIHWVTWVRGRNRCSGLQCRQRRRGLEFQLASIDPSRQETSLSRWWWMFSPMSLVQSCNCQPRKSHNPSSKAELKLAHHSSLGSSFDQFTRLSNSQLWCHWLDHLLLLPSKVLR